MRSITTALLMISYFGMMAQPIAATDTTACQSIGGIVNELLRLISSEEGKKKNLDAIENLFLPTAHLTVLMHDPSFPEPVETVSLAEFMELLADPYYEEGFQEKELRRIVEEYNGIAQVFQTFEAQDGDGEQVRGLTSYQLVYKDDRWWIVSLLWTDNSNEVPVPNQYLGN